MRVALELFATLAPFLPPDARTGDVASLEVRDGVTLQDVLEHLAIPPEISCIALVNGHDVPKEHPLRDGDVVSLFPPLAGGS